MKEDEEKAFGFWKRVDELRGDKRLKDLSAVIGIKEQSLRMMRSRCSIPRALAVKALAEYLGTTQSYLLEGDNGNETPAVTQDLPEVEYVRNSPEAQALIRAVMRNPRLLEALAVVIESEENYRKASNI